jgi:hypothetical protein
LVVERASSAPAASSAFELKLPLCVCLCVLLPPGDHVGLYARNSSEVVAEAARCLGLPLDTLFSLHTDGEGAK